jgi:hypothetical protein
MNDNDKTTFPSSHGKKESERERERYSNFARDGAREIHFCAYPVEHPCATCSYRRC